jgi:hypothetical protein
MEPRKSPALGFDSARILGPSLRASPGGLEALVFQSILGYFAAGTWNPDLEPGTRNPPRGT